MTQLQATEKAIRNFANWMGGAVVVTDESGEFDATPGANMTDCSYSGPSTVICEIADLSDIAPYGDGPRTDAEITETAQWLIDYSA